MGSEGEVSGYCERSSLDKSYSAVHSLLSAEISSLSDPSSVLFMFLCLSSLLKVYVEIQILVFLRHQSFESQRSLK